MLIKILNFYYQYSVDNLTKFWFNKIVFSHNNITKGRFSYTKTRLCLLLDKFLSIFRIQPSHKCDQKEKLISRVRESVLFRVIAAYNYPLPNLSRSEIGQVNSHRHKIDLWKTGWKDDFFHISQKWRAA